MKFNTSYVRVKGNDPFGDYRAAADFINTRAANAGYSSAPVGESSSHCIDFLEREISECAPEIREHFYIETIEEEVEE